MADDGKRLPALDVIMIFEEVGEVWRGEAPERTVSEGGGFLLEVFLAPKSLPRRSKTPQDAQLGLNMPQLGSTWLQLGSTWPQDAPTCST